LARRTRLPPEPIAFPTSRFQTSVSQAPLATSYPSGSFAKLS
jgi:hypothetical protein